MDGLSIAILGLAICVFLCGSGSAFGLCFTGRAAAAVLAEKPKAFGGVLTLSVLPATQGIYGFVLGIMGLGYLSPEMSVETGWAIFFAALPLAICGLVTGILQGLTSVAGLNAIAKKEVSFGRLILFPAMVETYAILALVISIMLLGAI